MEIALIIVSLVLVALFFVIKKKKASPELPRESAPTEPSPQAKSQQDAERKQGAERKERAEHEDESTSEQEHAEHPEPAGRPADEEPESPQHWPSAETSSSQEIPGRESAQSEDAGGAEPAQPQPEDRPSPRPEAETHEPESGPGEQEPSTPHGATASSQAEGQSPEATTAREGLPEESSEDRQPNEEFVSLAPESGDQESLPPKDERGTPPPPLVRGRPVQDKARRAGLLSLRKGLAKSRGSGGFFGKLKALLGGKKSLDPAIAEEIEEVLLTSDVGVKTTEKILQRLKEGMSRGDLNDDTKVFKALRDEAHKTLAVEGTAGSLVLSDRPTVVLFVGVNGAGKTTTIGKLAQKLSAEGKKVMLSAGDTFRAAAVEQLKAWGQRTGCEVVTGKEGADPSSVLYDAIAAAKTAGADVLLADTAGRLHTKTNLMQEMKKVQKVAGKALDGAPHETLLVIDSTNGQNALAQAREFKEALPLTGLVLTKLDGTAKGGVVLGICDDLKVPVRYVGVGERAEDLHAFDPSAFVEALLGAEDEELAA